MARQWGGPSSLDRLDQEPTGTSSSNAISAVISAPGIPEIELPPCHPSVELFPLLEGEELLDLANDIKEHGLSEKIWMWNDPERGRVLLDGRNRYRACKIAGVEPEEQEYTGNDPITFSLSRNLRRRHLKPGQRALAVLSAESMFAAEAAKRRNSHLARGIELPVEVKMPQRENEIETSPVRAPQTREVLAKIADVSPRVITQAKVVDAEAPDLAKEVWAGEKSIGKAARETLERRARPSRPVPGRDTHGCPDCGEYYTGTHDECRWKPFEIDFGLWVSKRKDRVRKLVGKYFQLLNTMPTNSQSAFRGIPAPKPTPKTRRGRR